MEIRDSVQIFEEAEIFSEDARLTFLDRLSAWLSAPQNLFMILFGASIVTAALLFFAASMSWQASREARILVHRLDKIERFEERMRKAFFKAQTNIHASLLETNSKIEGIGHSISRERAQNKKTAEKLSTVLVELQNLMDDAIAEKLEISALGGANSTGSEVALTTHSQAYRPVSRSLKKSTTPKSRVKHGGSRLFNRVVRADGSVAYERKAE